MRLLLGWLLVVLAIAGTPALAAYPARPAGPVLDQAQIIPDAEEAALDAKLRAYTQRTGRAIVVATVSSLDGETVEMYAVNLFEAWGIGGKESDQGLLFLIAPTERKVRFETGYGLHAIFPDVLAGRVIRNEVTPRFKSGDMVGGINAGVDSVITQLDRTPADAKAVAEAAATAEAQRSSSSSDGIGIGGVVFWVVLILFFMLMFGRRRHGVRRSGIDPGVILWGISEIAHHASDGDRGGGFGGGIDFGGGGFGGFGGGGSGGGGASGDW